MGDILHNRDYASQLKIFAGLKWGRISPTDIDGFLDFGDRLFVFIEAKHGNSMPPTGQRIALERLCDACASDRRTSVVLVAAHESTGDIIIKDQAVTAYRFRRRWRTPKTEMTVYQAINRFREIAGIDEDQR